MEKAKDTLGDALWPPGTFKRKEEPDMAEFTQDNLPVRLHTDDLLRLDDGTTIRYETSGEAKDIMLNDDFNAACQLFPGCDFTVTAGGKDFRVSTGYEENILVEAI